MAHINCFLCTHTFPEWYHAVEANAQLLRFAKGEVIFRQGEQIRGFYFLHSGSVKVHKHWVDDRELIIKFAGEGELLGHRAIGQDQLYPVSATAVEPVTACFITPEFFRTTLMANHEFAYQVILFFANELQKAEEGMRKLVQMDVKSRIAENLLKLQSFFGRDDEGFIRSTLTRQDIASYAGTTYETLFKTINEWEQEGWITTSGKKIAIIHPTSLEGVIR